MSSRVFVEVQTSLIQKGFFASSPVSCDLSKRVWAFDTHGVSWSFLFPAPFLSLSALLMKKQKSKMPQKFTLKKPRWKATASLNSGAVTVAVTAASLAL